MPGKHYSVNYETDPITGTCASCEEKFPTSELYDAVRVIDVPKGAYHINVALCAECCKALLNFASY